MIIFIDSNILCSDYYMKNYKFELINRVGDIVLGEIVIDEVCNKYKEQLKEAISMVDKNIKTINKLISDHISIDNISIVTIKYSAS